MLRAFIMVLLSVNLPLLENMHSRLLEIFTVKSIEVDFPCTTCFHKHKNKSRFPETHLISNLGIRS